MGTLLSCTLDNRNYELWIPNGALSESKVILCHDGQNIFSDKYSISGASWGMANTLQLLTSKGYREPIVIAPWSQMGAKRYYEYAPEDLLVENSTLFEGFKKWFKTPNATCSDLTGNSYSEWCVAELLPAIYAKLNLRREMNNIALLGSSMGAVASLYTLSRHPQIFSSALCMSTHWTPGGEKFAEALTDLLPDPGCHRIWFDYGDGGLDSDYARFQRVADKKMIEKGWKIGEDFESHFFPGAGHNESSWASRLDTVLIYCLRQGN